MHQLIKSILLLLVSITTLTAFAQTSNLHSKKIKADGLVKIDSVSLVPGSFTIPGIDTSFYSIDAVNALLLWKKRPSADSVFISYRSLPFKLNAVAQRYHYDSIQNNFIAEVPLSQRSESDNNIFNFGKLNYNGSLGRSVSFGNSQDAVFNSQLNLQLSGFIGDSIEMAAAITDNNIPIQPDGTTQQLNEFDKILLQFKKKNWEVDLGDIDLRQNPSYFLNFYKRLQGIAYMQQFKVGENITNKTTTSGAIAKGKFARNIFNGQEGNQGPYKLQGNNNELFFIVLAGTEKVFIDGVQLQRGEDQDYVINYNTAEVTFTPKQMITKDKRIQVEFEYADRNYLNTMLYISNETQFGKRFKLNVAAYSNADAKNSPINQTLDNNQKQFLANIGDSINDAYYPSASIDTFSSSAIMYKKIFVTYPGGSDSVYVYSTSPDSAFYNLSFVSVGANKGNYIPLYNAANGNVFEWIQPVNGVPQGSYEPATFLVTPKKQQIITVGGVYQLNTKTIVTSEFASSKYDVNTFSAKDKANDVGYGAKFSIQNNKQWKTGTGKQLNLLSAAGYEYVGKNYQSVERLRAVEFYRDWGLDYQPVAANEQLPSFTMHLSDDKLNSVEYKFTSYIRSDGYTGYRNVITHTQNFHGWQLNDAFNLVNDNSGIAGGFYLRPNIDVSKSLPQFHNYVIGASYALEHNEQHDKATDSVTAASYAFETIAAYLKSDPSKRNKWSFTYYTRSDKAPFEKSLLQTDRSHNYNFQTELLSNAHHQFRLSVTYRQLFITNQTLTTQTPDNSLLGRAEYNVNAGHGLFIGKTLYELGAGQEQKLNYSYVQVPAGQGQYTWIDYNNDGIQQLNEFVVALYPDQATFIRIFTPSNDYIKANCTQFNYSFTFNPRVLYKGKQSTSFVKFISRFMLQSSMQTYKKSQSNGNPTFNPFSGSINDTSLINLNLVISNTLSFNRSSTKWGVDVTNVQNSNKALLTYGFESRQLNDWTVKGRINLSRAYTFEILQKLGINNLSTPAFANQNYALNISSTQPSLTYISGTKFRVQASYAYTQKTNAVLYGGEKAGINSINIQTKYNTVSSTSLQAGFSYDNISFNGTANTTVSYIMLDALQPGKNYLWNISLTKRIINNLELNIEYEGRKPGDTRVINTGRASIRAVL
jgi:hypothetical protein